MSQGLPTPIQLVVGLGNPGAEYVHTRHNAGAWWVEALAESENSRLRPDAKFKGLYGQLNGAHRCHLLIPTTFMNLSGQAVRAVTDFYRVSAAQILVIHDELDLPVGETRLKFGGGHGGHNGLRDIISHLHTADFHRLRIGIGHPGDRRQVTDYVLTAASRADRERIHDSIAASMRILPLLWQGHMQKAMQELHTK